MNKTSIPAQPRLPAWTAHDAISTSSSTLVNPDLDEDVVRPRQHFPYSSTTNGRANSTHGMKPGVFTSKGWLKAETSTSFNRPPQLKREYPDDHRCSDQETASGLCGCNRDVSPESGSSSSPATVSEPEEDHQVRSTYDQQLLAARKRKLMMEKRSQSSETITVMRVETSSTLPESTSQSHYKSSDRLGSSSRNLLSDPVVVPRPSMNLSFHSHDDNLRSKASDLNEEWKDVPNRRWASSPVQPASHEYSRLQSTSFDRAQRRGATALAQSSPSSIPPPPPSAARKSISSVFEKLLKEEEQRREEERAKKEAARERRREQKRRKEEEWPPRTLDAQRDVLLEQQSQDRSAADLGVENGRDASKVDTPVAETNSLASSSQLQQDATRLERLSRQTLSSSSIVRIAPRPSPEKPAASSYKAKLAALRSASGEHKVPPFPILRPSNAVTAPRQSRAESASNNHSSGEDDSQASEGDQVTIGSDYQGRAPLQSTPPRNSPSTRSQSRMLLESPTARMKSPDSSLAEDSLRQTVQQLNAVLHEVREIKGDASMQPDQIPIVELRRANEQRELALQSVSDEGRKKITDIDQVFVQKLGRIRERLEKVKNKKPVDRVEERPSNFRIKSLLFTLLIQLLFAWLMMMAAEARARQLFLTTYYDPFLPHDLMDLSQVQSGSLLGPLLQNWSLLPDPFFIQDSLAQPQTLTATLSSAAHALLLGPDRTRALKLLSVKLFTLLGIDLSDTYQSGNFMPT
jgi:hypothetical protein